VSAKFIRHEGCPECGSSDALAIYEDGGAHCFSSGCNYHITGGNMTEKTQATPCRLNMGGTVAAIPQRRISQETCAHFGVTVEYSTTGEIIKHYYPYYKIDTNEVAAAKVREVKTKNFYTTGNSTGVGFFGQNQCTTNRYLTITEGELDALAVYEMSGQKWDVVSLRAGAANAAKEIKEQLEWLENYEQVVLCFDNDKAGDAALEQVKDLFSPNKLKIVKLPLKDASDMLMANRVKDFTQAWWNAKTYRPTGS